jgi:hypothetical protein
LGTGFSALTGNGLRFQLSRSDASFTVIRPLWATAFQFMSQMVCVRLKQAQILDSIIIIHPIQMVNHFRW